MSLGSLSNLCTNGKCHKCVSFYEIKNNVKSDRTFTPVRERRFWLLLWQESVFPPDDSNLSRESINRSSLIIRRPDQILSVSSVFRSQAPMPVPIIPSVGKIGRTDNIADTHPHKMHLAFHRAVHPTGFTTRRLIQCRNRTINRR